MGILRSISINNLKLQSSDKVMDIGCGIGASSIKMAKIVGDNGYIHGFDISNPMIRKARKMVKQSRIKNVKFTVADVQTEKFENNVFDAAYSAWGVMFFENPMEAFANIKKSLVPNGKLSFFCWAALENNSIFSIVLKTSAKFIEVKPLPSRTSPGPFAFQDSDYIYQVLKDAGFHDIVLKSHEQEIDYAHGLPIEKCVDALMKLFLDYEAIWNAQSNEYFEAIRSDLISQLSLHYQDNKLYLPTLSWAVTART